MNKQTITIIGGGLGGCFLAILLSNRGHKVDLYEKLSKKEISDTNTKRSYNITFLAYGIDLLKKANIWETLKPNLHPLNGVSTQLSKDTKPIFTPTYDKRNQYFAVSRASLLNLMLDKLEKNPLVTLHFETTLLSIDRYEKTMIIEDNKTKKIQIIPCDVIIGADGANSLVRPFIQLGQDTIHTQEYSKGGYKQFVIPLADVKKMNLQPGVAYTWSASEKFILAFPNFDDSLASLLIYPNDQQALASINSMATVKELLQKDFPLLNPCVNELSEQLIQNPVGKFVTIHTDPWYYKDFLAVVGDAAHGFYPFFGQGTSAAFGDCMQLVTLMDTYGTDWKKIFPIYQEARKKHMDALGELSKEGLQRYARNKRADYEAIYDKLESLGHGLFPNIISQSIIGPVMNDPEHTADFVEQTQKQRRKAKKIGVPLLVGALTGMVGVYENMQKTFSKTPTGK